MLISWSASADSDLAAILDYFITMGDEDLGKRIVSRLIKSVSPLRSQPRAGRLGRIGGTRELFPRKLPYVLVYQVPSSSEVEIVRIIHTSRLFPENFCDAEEGES